MPKEIAAPFMITCHTNTLMGSGKSNYGVIDQLVQRDSATHLPCFNGSGIKGGLKEYCHHARANAGADIDLKYIFGSEKLSDDDTQAGAFSFWQADLLCMPVRNSHYPMVHITSAGILLETAEKLLLAGHALAAPFQQLGEQVAALTAGGQPVSTDAALKDTFLEDEDIVIGHAAGLQVPKALDAILPAPLVFVPDPVMKILTDDLHLPVVARNRLLNGESKNLWYEQVLPRQTRMICCVQHWENDAHFDKLAGLLGGTLVQLGANASIGYGYCQFKKI